MSRACSIERHDSSPHHYGRARTPGNRPIHVPDHKSLECLNRLTRQPQAQWAERISQLRRMLIEEESSPQVVSNQALLWVAEEVLDFLDFTRWPS
jgi:hypothetical protein